MKCHICAHEIPEGKKYCPGCGRVVRFNTPASNDDTMKLADPLTELRKNSHKSATESADNQATINIPDIFSTDPNAPEYKDPHAYDTATAHILEYDRMFVSRSDDRERPRTTNIFDDDSTKKFSPVDDYGQTKRIVIQQEPEYNNYYEEQPEEDESETYVERPKKKAGPKINIKLILLLIAIIAGISICVMGVYRIGQQFGFWEGETSSQQAEKENPSDKDTPPVVKPANTVEDEENLPSDYKKGVYTVSSDQKNIFVYKSVTDQRITATIPTGTVIEITEIKEELGKTTYNSYTGWVDMKDLEYTPDKEPETEKETTTKAEDPSEVAPAFPTQPGTYTVNPGSSTYLNVRASASTQSTVVGILAKDSQIEVTEVDGFWGKVTVEGGTGWVYMPYLK